jgi:TPR repeat protein
MRRLKLSADAGDPDAQFNLGVVYANRPDDGGHALGTNRAEAFKWLLKAAAQGVPRAQGKLAELYGGEPEDSDSREEACFWYLLASASLSGIHRERAQSGYRSIAVALTPAEIARVEKRARLWRPVATVAGALPPEARSWKAAL